MKERLDVLLVSRGLAPSREKAKTMMPRPTMMDLSSSNQISYYIQKEELP